MQTFLPYPNFHKSLACLDYKRLGKQRIEALIILRNITGSPNRWINHPAVRMWMGYPDALMLYMNMAIKLWIGRGYRNSMEYQKPDFSHRIGLPSWFGDENFHRAHRQALLFKNYEYYSHYFPDDVPKIEYVWPV
jgi:hypothetical protein